MALTVPHSTTAFSLVDLFDAAHEAAEGQVTIGQSPESILCVSGTRASTVVVSARHAELDLCSVQLLLQDCGSQRGTWVNGQLLRRHNWTVLREGDIISLGGPPAVEVRGSVMRNPCCYKVERLAGFLASYTPGRRFATERQREGGLGPARRLNEPSHPTSAGPRRQPGRAAAAGESQPPTRLAAAPWTPHQPSRWARRRRPPPPPNPLQAVLNLLGGVLAGMNPWGRRDRPGAAPQVTEQGFRTEVVAPQPNQPEAIQEGASTTHPDCIEISDSRVICVKRQELVVRCVSIGCGHSFCGECLARWLANKRECPTCRAEVLEVPTWNSEIDALCNGALEQQLSAEDFGERQRRKRAAEQNRRQIEAALRAPWRPRTHTISNSSNRDGRMSARETQTTFSVRYEQRVMNTGGGGGGGMDMQQQLASLMALLVPLEGGGGGSVSRAQLEALLGAPSGPGADSNDHRGRALGGSGGSSGRAPGNSSGDASGTRGATTPFSSAGRTLGSRSSSSNRRDGAASDQAAAQRIAQAVAGSRGEPSRGHRVGASASAEAPASAEHPTQQQQQRSAPGRRAPDVPLTVAPTVPPPSQTQALLGQVPQFRVEYPSNTHDACRACQGRFMRYVVRFGAASRPNNYAGPHDQSSTAWYHINCVPQHCWRQSLLSGISNMRGVNRTDELRIKQMQRQAV